MGKAQLGCATVYAWHQCGSGSSVSLRTRGSLTRACPAFPAGINGAGKTTQLQIIAGNLQPTSGQLAKEKPNMRIAYLTQEFDVVPTRTVRVRRRAQAGGAHREGGACCVGKRPAAPPPGAAGAERCCSLRAGML